MIGPFTGACVATSSRPPEASRDGERGGDHAGSQTVSDKIRLDS
jgi:hypothetical protein